MPKLFFARGNRLFTAGSLLTIVVGALHTTGLANDPPNDAWADAFEVTRVATLSAGPFTMSLYDLYVGVWIQVGALLLMLGLTNLIVVSTTAGNTSALRAIAIFDCISFALLTTLFVYCQIPPPLVSFALLTLVFAGAAGSLSRGHTLLESSSSDE